MSETPRHRLKELNPDDLDTAQRAAYDDIVAGPRGRIAGPFNAWLRSPELAARAQRVGEFCRFNSSLAPRLFELGIILVARHHQAQVEWFFHARLAMEAGHFESTIADIKAGKRPDFSQDDEAVVYDLTEELLRTNRLSDAIYERALDILGETSLVELIGTIGYYAMVSMTLNAFNIPIPGDEEAPFPEPS